MPEGFCEIVDAGCQTEEEYHYQLVDRQHVLYLCSRCSQESSFDEDSEPTIIESPLESQLKESRQRFKDLEEAHSEKLKKYYDTILDEVKLELFHCEIGLRRQQDLVERDFAKQQTQIHNLTTANKNLITSLNSLTTPPDTPGRELPTSAPFTDNRTINLSCSCSQYTSGNYGPDSTAQSAINSTPPRSKSKDVVFPHRNLDSKLSKTSRTKIFQGRSRSSLPIVIEVDDVFPVNGEESSDKFQDDDDLPVFVVSNNSRTHSADSLPGSGIANVTKLEAEKRRSLSLMSPLYTESVAGANDAISPTATTKPFFGRRNSEASINSIAREGKAPSSGTMYNLFKLIRRKSDRSKQNHRSKDS